jgi:O-6-methylguanine DNA methyltransferase
MTTYIDQIPNRVRDLFVAVNQRGALVRLLFVSERSREQLEAGLPEPVKRDPGRCRHVAAQLDEYFAGKRTEFDLDLDLHGTPFQRSVWDELTRIPFGETISYRQLAGRIGRPTAVRAVGAANGANPVCLVVPCHRVIGADGSLTGFGGGIDVKRSLLKLEGSLQALF